MRLVSLELENYRRFKGLHTIHFAHEDDKNVTIIQAQNGAGKTGVLMALLFGLFGVVQYQEFNIDTNEQDILINREILNDSSKAYALVCVNFIDNQKHYKISRKIYGSNISGYLSQDIENVESKMLIDGLEESTDTVEINKIMNGKIGENIRGFLFFDGVKYMNLFQKDHNRYKKELQEIIEKMLNINDLDTCITQLKYLEASLYISDIAKKYNRRKTEYLNEISQIKEQIQNTKKTISDLSNEIERNEKSKARVIKELEDLGDYNTILRDLSAKQKQKSDHIDEIEAKSGSLLVDGSNTIKKAINNKLRKELYHRIDNIINDDISIDKALVDSIIKTGQCICGTDLEEKHYENFKSLLVEMENEPKANQDYIYVLKKIRDEMNMDYDIESNLVDYCYEWTEMMNKLNDFDLEISELETSVPIDRDDLTENFADSNKNLGALNTTISARKNDLEKNQNILNTLSTDLDKIEYKLEQVNQEIAFESGKEEEYNFYRKTRESLISLRKSYLIQAQKDISNKANEYFKRLLSEHDNQAIAMLKINENYKIEAYDNNGSEIFQQLSAGQKHLSAMAFTMGLTAVATEAINQFQYPLVMDTPFSNLDTPNRRRLINLMPEVVQQWILTPMDTELSNNEIVAFNNTNRVGATYQIIKEGASSKITKYDSIYKLKGSD